MDLVAEGIPVQAAKRKVFQTDIQAISRSDLVVAILDGRVIDEGVCVELGYAYAVGKLCVGLKTDIRSMLPIGDNPMVECVLSECFAAEHDLYTWLAAHTQYAREIEARPQ